MIKPTILFIWEIFRDVLPCGSLNNIRWKKNSRSLTHMNMTHKIHLIHQIHLVYLLHQQTDLQFTVQKK